MGSTMHHGAGVFRRGRSIFHCGPIQTIDAGGRMSAVEPLINTTAYGARKQRLNIQF